MSDYRVTCGLMAELAFPVPEDKYEETCNKLYKHNSKLQINYDGTLIYSEDIDVELYEFEIQLGQTISTEEFTKQCNEQNLPFIGEPKPFTTAWYDGTDSPQSLMTLSDFQGK